VGETGRGLKEEEGPESHGREYKATATLARLRRVG
jgi:hypothetical protein